MEEDRRRWSEKHAELREVLKQPKDIQAVLDHFLPVHAYVHAAEMSGLKDGSFTDEVWQGITADLARKISAEDEHSFVWIFWHLARIEDITMNLLIGGRPQVIDQDDWLKKVNAPFRHAGNDITPGEMTALNEKVDVDALRAYHSVVGQSTRVVVAAMDPKDVKKKVDPARLQRVMAQGDLLPTAVGPIGYWAGLTYAGLLLMPPTRHCLLHHNEALRLRKKLLKK